ncbi:MAG: hypothetical protein KatS3mg105_0872 [Gemmatales bacterium]|nr:MAG: hypothetical protein KatS3mg105_0872 [Gemmatales bacterium]
MLPREIIRQIRRLQLFARRAVEDVLGGEYRSVFKGAGIAFEEVREYQPGDDVRAIDWNVTARMGHPYIKRFVEERELTVMLVVDVSGSQRFGSRFQRKREVAADLAALLAFCAVSNNDKVGLIQFTDEVEHYLPPRKGTRHVLRLIRDILYFQPGRDGTSLRTALQFLNRVRRKRAIVFVLSDFLDRDYDNLLKRTGLRHDMTMVRIVDRLEEEFPAAGLVHFADAETHETVLVDTSRQGFGEQFSRQAQQRRDALRQLARASFSELFEVTTNGDHLDALVRYFERRERHQRAFALPQR